MTWAATQAKAKFSEVLDRAESEGPQLVRRRKQDFYVITREQHESLTALRAKLPKRSLRSQDGAGTLGEFFRNSPLAKSGIEIKRTKSVPRQVKF